MPDIAEMDSYEMLCEDWGSAYLITRAPAAAHPYQAERRDDPAVILTAASPAALRELIRADYRPAPSPGRWLREQRRAAAASCACRTRDHHPAQAPCGRADHL